MGTSLRLSPRRDVVRRDGGQRLRYLRANYEAADRSRPKNSVSDRATISSAMVPQLRSDDILGGAFCSTDGFVDPYSVMTGFTLRAVDQGSALQFATPKSPAWCSMRKESRRSRPRKAPSRRVSSSTPRVLGRRRSQNMRKRRSSRWNRCDACWCRLSPSTKWHTTSPMVVDISTGFQFRPEGLEACCSPGTIRKKRHGYKAHSDRSFIKEDFRLAADPRAGVRGAGE